MTDPGSRDAQLRDLVHRLLPGESWGPWEAILAACFALAPLAGEEALYRQVTGRTTWPSRPARELWCIAGRRGGKSRISALLAVYLACFKTYYLAPGEKGVVMVVAPNRRQAQIVLSYVESFLAGSPPLAAMIIGRTAEAITLGNNVIVEVHTCSFRSLRGYTCVAGIRNEVAYFRSEDSADPDREVLAAIRPSMATVPDPLLIAISSPHSQSGELFETYDRHFGKDGDDVLVVQAATKTLNPTIAQSVIDRAYGQDAAVAAAEFGGAFRADLERVYTREIMARVTPARARQPDSSNYRPPILR